MMTTIESFDADSWIKDLSGILDELVPDADYSVSETVVGSNGETQDYTRRVSYAEYLERASAAKTQSDADEFFEKSHVWFGGDTGRSTAVLVQHPILRAALNGATNDAAVVFVYPYGDFHVEMRSLVANLVKLLIKAGGNKAAETLHRFLTNGSNGELTAHDIVLFYGLKLNHRIDIGDGAYLVPYDVAKSEFSLPSQNELAGNFPREFGNRQSRTEPGMALVRELNWSPTVMSADQELKDVLNVKYRFPFGYTAAGESDSAFRHNQGYELVRDLLAIASAKNVVSRQHFIKVDRWIVDLDPNFAFGWRSGSSWINDWWRNSEIDDECLETFNRLVQGWVDNSANGLRIEHVIRRLATASSRTGRSGIEDKIVDTSIALEMLYVDDGGTGEISHKFKTRVARFLGQDKKHRADLWKQAGLVYDARSAIVHGNEKEKKKLDSNGVLIAGYELAIASLLKMLEVKQKPDWKQVVLS